LGGSAELNPTLTRDSSAIKTWRTADQAAGAACGMAGDNMEMLADEMRMYRDFLCFENKSEVKSGAAM
jgi:hypothetical protein